MQTVICGAVRGRKIRIDDNVMKIIKEYLRFDGRISRKDYWLRTLRLMIFGHITLVLGYALTINISTSLAPPFLLVLLLVMASSICISVRRLHDREISGWWIILFQFLPIPITIMLGNLGFLVLPLVIWGVVEIGFMRGTRGYNKYGDDPLKTET